MADEPIVRNKNSYEYGRLAEDEMDEAADAAREGEPVYAAIHVARAQVWATLAVARAQR